MPLDISKITSFMPLVRSDSRILILGSMPSVESLNQQQYYAHPQNAFWRLIPALWGDADLTDYDSRVQYLLNHHLALWDVLQDCQRKGSADSAIRDAVANNFRTFFAQWPQICLVAFNGQAAARLFNQLVLKPAGYRTIADFRTGLQAIQLGSTSPAHAVPFAERLQDWLQIKTAVESSTAADQFSV